MKTRTVFFGITIVLVWMIPHLVLAQPDSSPVTINGSHNIVIQQGQGSEIEPRPFGFLPPLPPLPPIAPLWKDFDLDFGVGFSFPFSHTANVPQAGTSNISGVLVDLLFNDFSFDTGFLTLDYEGTGESIGIIRTGIGFKVIDLLLVDVRLGVGIGVISPTNLASTAVYGDSGDLSQHVFAKGVLIVAPGLRLIGNYELNRASLVKLDGSGETDFSGESMTAGMMWIF